jgi:hypothetical protein
VALNAGGIAGGLLLGRLVDKRQPYGMLTVAYVCAAVLVAAMGALGLGSVLALMSAIVAAGFLVIGTQYSMNALAANFYPTGLRSTGIGWAQGIGPSVRSSGLCSAVYCCLSGGLPARCLWQLPYRPWSHRWLISCLGGGSDRSYPRQSLRARKPPGQTAR